MFETAAREHIASRGSRDTRGIYLHDLGKWLVFCQLEAVDPDAPPFPAAVKFRDQLEAEYAAMTVRRILSALSSMYDSAGLVNHFKSEKRLPRPPADEVALTQAFSDDEMKALFVAAKDDLETTTVMRLLCDTGMRVSEVLSIRRSDLVKEGEVLVIVGKVKKKGRVKTPLTEASAKCLTRWLKKREGSGYVFPADRGTGFLSRQAFGRKLVQYAAVAKVTGAHAHRFRATFATAALDAGVPLHEVQAALHHADPKTTLRYDRGVRGMGVAERVAEWRKGK